MAEDEIYYRENWRWFILTGIVILFALIYGDRLILSGLLIIEFSTTLAYNLSRPKKPSQSSRSGKK